MHEGAQQAAELTVHYAGTTKTVPFAWSIQNNLVRDNYAQMLQDAPTVSMTYENL
jgi:hypothetical protein